MITENTNSLAVQTNTSHDKNAPSFTCAEIHSTTPCTAISSALTERDLAEHHVDLRAAAEHQLGMTSLPRRRKYPGALLPQDVLTHGVTDAFHQMKGHYKQVGIMDACNVRQFYDAVARSGRITGGESVFPPTTATTKSGVARGQQHHASKRHVPHRRTHNQHSVIAGNRSERTS